MANNSVKPFVKPGTPLGFVAQLKERGLWPPRLHDRKDQHADHRPVTTPFLVVPVTTPGDSGARPQPNSKAFHSQAIWLEEIGGTIVATPVAGGHYLVKCRISNLGAFPAYGGLADFFVNAPKVFTAAAGTSATLPSLGHTGFSLPANQGTVITCPNLWKPTTLAELSSSLVVHVYDLFADNLLLRFDARNDRHVGRHDLAPDVYVRDWTDSAAVHDRGREPSTRNVFFTTSDVWNRRSAAPGGFVDDQPQNQNPQQGTGAAGDNVIFARVSRNDASVDQTVRAHFLVAEFGTGSPFVDCSSAPDPSVTLAAGQMSAIVSLPWHLHPSSSTHLCLAVQVYSDADPYMPPGLLGYTPGWPTTDLMVINDNNKAQRNIAVWDGVPETEGVLFGLVFNAATFVRDVQLGVDLSDGALERFANARVSVPMSGLSQDLRPGMDLVLKRMLPGERRWVAFSYDRFTPGRSATSVLFNERRNNLTVNGFGFTLRPMAPAAVLRNTIDAQSAAFYRMSEGLGIQSAGEGLAICRRLQEPGADAKAYFRALPQIVDVMSRCLNEISGRFGGMRDLFGIGESLSRLRHGSERLSAPTFAAHHTVLNQLDAFQTTALKSRGDTADILFTLRLQRDVYGAKPFASSDRFSALRRATDEFVAAYPASRDRVASYAPFVRSNLGYLEQTLGAVDAGPVRARFAELGKSLGGSPEGVQKAHLNFLNAVLIASGG